MLSSNNHGESFWWGSSKTATLVIPPSPECYSLFSISDVRLDVPLVVQSFAASMRCYEFRHLVPSWMIYGLAVAACLYSTNLTGTEYSSKTKLNSTKPLTGNPLTRMPIDSHWSHSDWFRQSWSRERLMRNALTTCVHHLREQLCLHGLWNWLCSSSEDNALSSRSLFSVWPFFTAVSRNLHPYFHRWVVEVCSAVRSVRVALQGS